MRFHGFSLRLAMIAGLLLTFTLAVAAQETPEPDAPEFVLPILTADSPVTGAAIESNATFLYGLYGRAGDVISVSMLQDEGAAIDPFLVVLGAYGEVLAHDDDGGPNGAALISGLELPTDGLYFVLATTFNDVNNAFQGEPFDEPQGYTLAVSGLSVLTDDETQDMKFYHHLLTGTDELIGYISASEPVFYFAYVAEEGDHISLSVRSTDFDPMVKVFAPGGARSAFSDDVSPVDTNAALEDVTVESAGMHVFFITDRDFIRAADEDAAERFPAGNFDFSFAVTGAGE